MAQSPYYIQKSMYHQVTQRIEIKVSPAVWDHINEKSCSRPSLISIDIPLEKYNHTSPQKW